MVSLQRGFGVAASQTPIAVMLAKRLELLGGKAARPACLAALLLRRLLALADLTFSGLSSAHFLLRAITSSRSRS